ncbi:MAG: thioredoxin family protein [Candidatus Cloacimonetes bacterium]|nr:thioredoxin family protein [Candidatus Cloacimonadota bacterium]
MMKKSLAVLFFLVTLTLIYAGNINWQSNVDDALQRAKENDKYVFVFFTGSDWCSWCHKLTGEVFDHQEFQNYVNKKMEMVLLDFPQTITLPQDQAAYNEAQLEKYGVRGFPSIIILENNGDVAMQLGYREGGPVKYVEYIEGVLNWNDSPKNETWEDKKGQVWYKNLDTAQKLATKENKRILVNFTGSDWCVWCKRLSNEVFLQPEFIEFADENLILLRLDFPKSTSLPPGEESYNNSLAQKFGVKGFPTIFLLDAKGNTIQKLGYEEGGAVSYVAHLRDLIK